MLAPVLTSSQPTTLAVLVLQLPIYQGRRPGVGRVSPASALLLSAIVECGGLAAELLVAICADSVVVFRPENGRATDGAVVVAARNTGLGVMIVRACPRSDAMDGGGDRRRFSARQAAGRSRQIATNGRMTDRQTGREVDVDSSRARRETGTK